MVIFYLLFPLDIELLKNPDIVGIGVVFSFQETLIRASKAGILSHLWWVVFHFQGFHRPIGSFSD